MSMIAAFGCDIFVIELPHQLIGGIGHRNVQLFAEHSDVQPQESILHQQFFAGFHRVVDQISNQDTQVDVADCEFLRNGRFKVKGNFLFLCIRKFGVEDCIQRYIATFHHLADIVQIFLQPSQIFRCKLILSHSKLCFERLNMVVVVVSPSPHGKVKVLYLLNLLFDHLILVFHHAFLITFAQKALVVFCKEKYQSHHQS